MTVSKHFCKRGTLTPPVLSQQCEHSVRLEVTEDAEGKRRQTVPAPWPDVSSVFHRVLKTLLKKQLGNRHNKHRTLLKHGTLGEGWSSHLHSLICLNIHTFGSSSEAKNVLTHLLLHPLNPALIHHSTGKKLTYCQIYIYKNKHIILVYLVY